MRRQKTVTSYAHMVPHDIPQKVDPKSIQRASAKTNDDEPLLKSGDQLITAKLKGSPQVKKYREAHQKMLHAKKQGKLADLAAAGAVAISSVNNDPAK
jgi:hypothetical protein